MKAFSISILSVFLAILTLSSTSYSPKTVIYIVRHAEKDLSDPASKDPRLNAEGEERAETLKKLLKKVKFSAVYATKYKRTTQTVAPTAQRNGIPVQTYDKADKEFADMIKSEYLNKTTLIGGHSNTVLDLVRSFGLTPPVAALTEDDYDLIFKISIDKKGASTLTTQRYGKKKHTTSVPGLE